MDLTKFWFVWNPAAAVPRFRHPSKAEAQREAERLARQHPGQQFIVLKAVGGAIVPVTNVDQIKFVPAVEDDFPF